MRHYLHILALGVSLLLAHNTELLAQNPPWFNCNNVGVTNCNSDVPSLFVDMRGYPSGKWYSCDLQRGEDFDTCCGYSQTTSNERCIEFKVLLDPAAEGFLFELVNVGTDPEWKGPGGGAPGDKDAPELPTFPIPAMPQTSPTA